MVCWSRLLVAGSLAACCVAETTLWDEEIWPKGDQAGTCNKDTGGVCYIFACGESRHATCYDHKCVCPAGMCDDNGGCRVEVKETHCCGMQWKMANVDVTHGDDGSCVFEKTSGDATKADAWAISETSMVRGIAFGPAGENDAVRTVGITADRTDLRDFPHGGYMTLEENGRAASLVPAFHYEGKDVLNMTIVDVPGEAVKNTAFYHNGKYLGQDGSVMMPRSTAAKIWFTAYSKIEIFGCKQLVDCKLSEWTKWSSCSKTCGEGTRVRTRKVDVPAQNGGDQCVGDLSQESPCQDVLCPINCEWSDWSDWSGSSTTCGAGTRQRTHEVAVKAQNNGKDCEGGEIGTEPVEGAPCPVDCAFSDWGNWTSCSTSCGPGVSTRARTIAVKAEYGGVECKGTLAEEETCGEDNHCPVDCEWELWTPWSKCSAECGGGMTSRDRDIKTKAAYGGVNCEGSSSETHECNQFPCAPIDCAWGEWSEFAQCSRSCGGGLQTKARKITTLASFGGKTCEGGSVFTQTCNTQPCPSTMECMYGPWSTWGVCTKSCDSGLSTRTREIVQPAVGDGEQCHAFTEETMECGLQPCEDFVNWKFTNVESDGETFALAGESGDAVTVNPSVMALSVKKVGAGGSVLFGLTDDAADATASQFTLASDDIITVAIQAGNLVKYVNHDGPTILGPTSSKAMYAKVLLSGEGAKAKVMQVLTRPFQTATFLAGVAPPVTAGLLAATTKSEPIEAASTFSSTTLVGFAGGFAFAMIIAVSLRLWRFRPAGAMYEPLM